MHYIRIIATFVITTTLSACSSPFSLERDKPLSNYQLCAQIKRQIIFYKNDPNHNYEWASPTDHAKLLAEFREHNCENVLEEKN